jgi:hypothetical protein
MKDEQNNEHRYSDLSFEQNMAVCMLNPREEYIHTNDL